MPRRPKTFGSKLTTISIGEHFVFISIAVGFGGPSVYKTECLCPTFVKHKWEYILILTLIPILN